MSGEDEDLDKLEELELDAVEAAASDIDLDAAVKEEEILEEMNQVRDKLGDGIDRLGEEMRHVFDWQSYVRSAPLTSVGIALAAGYLIAPALRSRPHFNPGIQAQPMQPAASGGLFSSLASTVFATVSRIATAYVTDMFVSQMAAPQPDAGTNETAQRHPDQPLDLGY